MVHRHRGIWEVLLGTAEQAKRDGSLIVRLQLAGYADKSCGLTALQKVRTGESPTPVRPLPPSAVAGPEPELARLRLCHRPCLQKRRLMSQTKPVFEVID